MINKVTLLGNLGKDPEVKELQNGKVCNFSVATSYKWKDKTSGERKEETEWHNVTCYGGLATVASSYLRKGSKVYIEGRIKTRKYEAKDGTERYITEIVADTLQMLDGKPDETTQAF